MICLGIRSKLPEPVPKLEGGKDRQAKGGDDKEKDGYSGPEKIGTAHDPHEPGVRAGAAGEVKKQDRPGHKHQANGHKRRPPMGRDGSHRQKPQGAQQAKRSGLKKPPAYHT